MTDITKVKDWATLNTEMIALCESTGVDMYQKMQLLTFVQLLEAREYPMVPWKMYSAEPNVVTFDFVSKSAKQFVVMNVSFLMNGTTVFTVSDFCTRKFAPVLKFLLFPKFQKRYFYFDYEATEATHDVMSKFMDISDKVRDSAVSGKPVRKLENFISSSLGNRKAKYK